MTLYDDILNQTQRLTPDEQARLARTQEPTEPKRWEDMRGAAVYPLIAENAQEWVSTSRQQDEHNQSSRALCHL